MASRCASWACSAAMAFNVTASLISGFSLPSFSSSSCRALNNAALCTPQEAHMLFGNTTGGSRWPRLRRAAAASAALGLGGRAAGVPGLLPPRGPHVPRSSGLHRRPRPRARTAAGAACGAFRPGARARVRAPASVPISPRVPRQRSMFTLPPPPPCAIELPACACRHACIRTRVDVCLHTQASGACAHANAHALRAQISRHTKRACVHPRCLASPALPHRVPCVRVCARVLRSTGMQPAA
jgi:hypothetical protein